MSLIKRMRENAAKLIAASLVMVSALAPGLAVASTSQPRDCDSNSILFCGAYSKSEWLNKVNNGDTKNSASNIQDIYFNQGRGITRANFQSSSTVDGTVFKDGRVVVDGKVVATNAKSIGRTFEPGSVKSGTVWMRPTQTSFVADSIPSWVNMDGGTFHFFIVKSCGNAGVATPTPKPSPTPTPTPVQQSFFCQSLTVTRPDTNVPDRFKFTITPKTKNVTVTGFRFTFSNMKNAIDTNADTPFTIQDIAPGTVTVNGQVKTNKGTTPLGQCVASVTVKHETVTKKVVTHVTVVNKITIVNEQQQTQTQTQTQELPPVEVPTGSPAPVPTAGQVLGATLPATGPETALGGVAGLSAIAFAGRAYLRSRKSLLGSLRGKNRDL